MATPLDQTVVPATAGKQTGPDQARGRQPVLKLPEEVDLMKELGLGRGVDGTTPTPWLKRTGFQVHKVTDDNIVGTDEGGTLQQYVREVTNVRSQQSTLKASIDVPKSPLVIGVDAEYSRTFTKSRKSVGIRIHNRTISFASDFDEASDWMIRDLECPELQRPMIQDDRGGKAKLDDATPKSGDQPTESAKDEKLKSELTFEERMCTWILDEINRESETSDDDRTSQASSSPIAGFGKYFNAHKTEGTVCKEVDDHCARFVNHFRITHYVSAIHLGAVKYDILEEEEYYHKLGSSSRVAVEKVGELDFSTNIKWTRTTRDSTMSKIGVMKERDLEDSSLGMMVHREDEAVIGAEIKCLSQLISHPGLRKSLQRALKDYMDKAQNDQGKLPCG